MDYWTLRRQACEEHGLLAEQLDYSLARIVKVAAISTHSQYAGFSISSQGHQIYFETHNLPVPRTLVPDSPCFREPNDRRERIFYDLAHSSEYDLSLTGNDSTRIGGYYGIPILGPDRERVVGTLAVAHSAPRHYDRLGLNSTIMRNLGRVVEDTLSARREVIRDPLTGLYNRRYTDEFIINEFSRAKRLDLPIATFLIDIDHFKEINDNIGHSHGDSVIREVAKILSSCFKRASDTLSRYGGEEFSVIALNTSLDKAMTVAERARSAVELAALDHPTRGVVTVSIGVFVYVDSSQLDKKKPEAAFENADMALYEAKRAGRNKVTCSLA